jgi:hypothetical protein
MTAYLIYRGGALSQRTIVIMKHNMVVRAAGAEGAKGFRLIVFPTEQNAPGVGLQVDAVRQVSQSPSNLTYEFHFCWSSRRMCLENGGNRSNQELLNHMTTEERD